MGSARVSLAVVAVPAMTSNHELLSRNAVAIDLLNECIRRIAELCPPEACAPFWVK